jgi:hypothetical protein
VSIETCKDFSEQVEREIQVLYGEMNRDFKRIFAGRIESEAAYHEKSLGYWEDLIKTFE